APGWQSAGPGSGPRQNRPGYSVRRTAGRSGAAGRTPASAGAPLRSMYRGSYVRGNGTAARATGGRRTSIVRQPTAAARTAELVHRGADPGRR
nr:hypothetical protein [Tanacetum cinerariifolium]